MCVCLKIRYSDSSVFFFEIVLAVVVLCLYCVDSVNIVISLHIFKSLIF